MLLMSWLCCGTLIGGLGGRADCGCFSVVTSECRREFLCCLTGRGGLSRRQGGEGKELMSISMSIHGI